MVSPATSVNVNISLTKCTTWGNVERYMAQPVTIVCHLFGRHTSIYFLSHTHKLAKIEWDRLFSLFSGWALDVRWCYKTPLPFPLVSQTLAVSETHVELTSICVARVGHSSRPRHATRQVSEQGGCKSHMTLAFVYHIIFQSSAFHLSLRHRAASQHGRPARLVMEGGERETHRLMKRRDLCFSDRDGLQHAKLCVGLIVCEDRKWDEYKLSWGWMSIVVVFFGLSFIWRHIRLFCAFFVIPVMQSLLSSAHMNMHMHVCNLF